MRWPLACVLALASAEWACHSAPPPGPAPSACEPAVPEHAQHPITSRAADLAGDYELIQVRTQPGSGVTFGRLHLSPVDSAARAGASGAAARDLIGWMDPVRGDRSGHPDARSRSPDHPGAVLTGSHLLLGQPGSRDGQVEELTITAVASDGFWGWWKAEPGWEIAMDTATRRVLPDPAGYFCAVRLPQTR